MSELALKLIEENKVTKAKFLDLGNCGIVGAVPEEIGECIWLEELSFSKKWSDWNGQEWVEKETANSRLSNNIAQLPSSIANLKSLKKLWIKGVEGERFDLVDLSPISELAELQELFCSFTKVDSLSPLSGLLNLQKLYCTETEINDLTALSGLIKLKELSTGKTKITDLASISGLVDLEELYCYQTEVSDLSALSGLNKLRILSCGRTNIADLTPLFELTNLQELYLDETKVSNLKPLTNLITLKQLYFPSTKVTDLSPLADLINLKILFCSNTSIDDLSSIPWQKFEQLKHLTISNTQVKNLFHLLPLLRKGIKVEWGKRGGGIQVQDCPLADPPPAVVKQGNEAILRYFEEKKAQGEGKLCEAKIVVVGAGGSGKTTLIKKLLDPKYLVPNPEDIRTEGIHVDSYPFEGKIAGESKVLKAHLWDFGGQILYYTTHQLFLTADTLYVLLNDNRKNDTDFYYWLNIVTLRAVEKCPVLVVFNAKDNAPRQIIPNQELFQAFGNLLPAVIDVNFADKDLAPVYRLKSTIEGYFSQLDVLGKSFPAYWLQVREALGKLPDEYITRSEFTKICKEYLVNDTQQMRILAQTLHNLGVLLFFPDVFGLEDLIVLKPQWCIDAIYGALDLPEIVQNAGRFNETMLADKWSNNRFSGNKLQLIKLMQHFDLCYLVEGTQDYIAPQLLPLEELHDPDFPKKGPIIHRFDYIFMPAGMLTRLIARLSLYIKIPYVWRTGVTLQWEDGTVAEVTENQLSRDIIIRVGGPDRKRRLAEIRKTLYELHKSFRGLKFKEWVSCNCPDCINSISPKDFSLAELESFASFNLEVVCTNGIPKKILAQEVLDGIEYVDMPRIFISYSHKNEKFKNEFRTMIRPMERDGQWKVWDDRWLLPGDNWNPEILRHLGEANVIVLMLTVDFFNSDYINDKEMSRAIQRHESGDALVIGIIVDHCLFEETPLGRIQILPKDGKPVTTYANRNEVWKAVAQKIKETIAIREGKQKRKGGWNEVGIR